MVTPDAEGERVDSKGPITQQLNAQEENWNNGLEAQIESGVDSLVREGETFLEFKRNNHSLEGMPSQLVNVRDKVYILTCHEEEEVCEEKFDNIPVNLRKGGVVSRTGIEVFCGEKVGIIPVRLTSEITDERRIVHITSDGDKLYAVIGEERSESSGYIENGEIAIINDLDQIASIRLSRIYFIVLPPKKNGMYASSYHGLRYMCVKTDDNQIALVNIADGKLIRTLDLGEVVCDATFSNDGTKLHVLVGDYNFTTITYEEIIRLPKDKVTSFVKGLVDKVKALKDYRRDSTDGVIKDDGLNGVVDDSAERSPCATTQLETPRGDSYQK